MIKIKTLDKETATSLQYVFITFIPLINYIFGVWFGSGGLYFSLMMILFLTVYKTSKRISIKSSALWMIYFSILIIYAIYAFFSQNSDLNGLQMILYIFLPALVALSKIDMHKFIRYSTYSALSILIVLPTLIRDLSNEGVRQISVNGISYAVVPVVIAGLYHFVFFRKEFSNALIRICYIVDVIISVLLIAYGNRGAVLSLIIAGFAAIVFNQREKMTVRRGVLLSILLVASIMFVMNYQSIVLTLYNTLLKFDIDFKPISKLYLLIQKQNILNGRDDINTYVISHLNESIVWGHGLSTIYVNSGGNIEYPHNLILQLFYDGGLILSIPVIFLFIAMAIYLFRGKETNLRIFILFFSTVCIPKMMLSSDIWRNPAFWLFVFAMFNHSGRNVYGHISIVDNNR